MPLSEQSELNPSEQSEWKLCLNWLVSTNMLPPDHVLMTSEPTLVDVGQLLNDGVFLCLLLNKLKPNLIDRKLFSQRPHSSQYVCTRNIGVFLKACKDGFGLKNDDLFEVQDLLDMKQFGKVIRTLSLLSQTREATSGRYVPFRIDSRTSSSEYLNMPGLLIHNMTVDSSMDYLNPVFIEDEHIYENIYENIAFQLCIPSPPVSRVTPKSLSTKSKREYIIAEILDSEKKYIDFLHMIKEKFMKTLASDLQPSESQHIFSCIKDLHMSHAQFYKDLCAVVAGESSNRTIADCFISAKEKFLIYSEYCSNVSTSRHLLESICKTRPSFRQKLEDCELAAGVGQCTLQGILMAPVQRILKYHLLLKELASEGNDDEEKRSLNHALDEMLDVAKYINEATRDTESLNIINELESKIFELMMPKGTHLRDYGHLIHDGELTVKTVSSNTRAVIRRYIFLFDKLMLVCSQRNDKYDYQEFLILNAYNLDRKETFTGCSFTLVSTYKLSSYIFTAKSKEDRSKWVKAIEIASDNEKPKFAFNEHHRFVQTTFKQPTNCNICHKLLKGTFFQGYKCQKTYQVVHKACIEKATQNSRLRAINITTKGSNTSSYTSSSPPLSSKKINVEFDFPVRPIGRVRAVTDYRGYPSPTENLPLLNFNKGDLFDLMENTGQWWKGQIGCEDGSVEEGYFPAESCFIVRIRESSGRGLTPATSLDSYEPLAPTPAPRPRLERSQTVPNRQSGQFCPIRPKPLGTDIQSYPWFAGKLVRTEASKILEDLPNGSYLVRHSLDSGPRGQDVLSVKYDVVQHIRIEDSDSSDRKLSIDESVWFNTLPELIAYYQDHSLASSFPEVLTALLWPYKDAVASSSFMS